MFIVTCPHCSRDLRVSREIAKAKMKCRYCGAIFVGSTHTGGTASPQPQADAPAATPQPAPAKTPDRTSTKRTPAEAPSPQPTVHARAARSTPTDAPVPVSVSPAAAKPAATPQPAPQPTAATASPVQHAQPPQPTAHHAHSGHHNHTTPPSHAHHHHHLHHQPPKRRAPMIWATVLVLCLIGAAIGGIAFVVNSHSPNGSLTGSSATNGAAGSNAQEKVSIHDLQEAAREGLHQRQSSAPLAEPSTPIDSPPEVEPVSAPTATTKTNPSVRILDVQPVKGLADEISGITGSFVNNNTTLFRSVSIAVTVKNPQGATRVLNSRRYEWIPPDMRGRFSIATTDILPADTSIDQTIGYGIPADTDQVGWMLTSFSRRLTDSGDIQLRGRSENPHKAPVTDVEIWCDFFTIDGVYAGTAKGEVAGEASQIDPRASFDFVVNFKPQYSAELIDTVLPRAVGTMP